MVDNVENVRLASAVNGTPAVVLDIQRQPGANIIETADRVKKLLPKLSASLPPSVKVEILTDRTETIRASVKDVQFTLLLTIGLVVMVIFVFLRKFWATVIPSVALPLAIVGTFGVMKLVGFSLDNLSLMALTIATGFVVDDAIVMIENIVRYIEMGEEPMEAALKGARQIGFTVISLSVSLIAVFIPLLFMTGIVGRLVSRVCDYAERGRRGLGGRFTDAHADDVRASVEGGKTRRARPLLHGHRAISSMRCCTTTIWGWSGCCGISFSRSWWRWARWSARSGSISSCRRGCCRSRIPA